MDTEKGFQVKTFYFNLFYIQTEQFRNTGSLISGELLNI